MRSFAHKDIKISWKNKQKGVKNEFLLFYVGFRLHAESSFSSSVPGCPACRNGTATGGLHAADRRGRTCGRFGRRCRTRCPSRRGCAIGVRLAAQAVAVQPAGEGEPHQFVPLVVCQCEGTPLAVSDASQVAPCVIKALMADGTSCTYFLQSHRNSFTIDNGLCHKFEINRRIVLVQFVETASN